MATRRRKGPAKARTRTILLDAAEELVLELGCAAVTSRGVAGRAGLNPCTLYYYFDTMDELLVEVLHRHAENVLCRHAEALASPNPLATLWQFSTDARATALTMEFAALANHRETIRAAVAYYSSRIREAEIGALAVFLDGSDSDCPSVPVLAVVLASLSRATAIEEAIGVTSGHKETLDFVERQLHRIEMNRSQHL